MSHSGQEDHGYTSFRTDGHYVDSHFWYYTESNGSSENVVVFLMRHTISNKSMQLTKKDPNFNPA